VDTSEPSTLSVGGRLSYVEDDTMIVWTEFALSNPTGGTSTLLPQGLYLQIGNSVLYKIQIGDAKLWQMHQRETHRIGKFYSGTTITYFTTQRMTSVVR
jgi:hypothetical protein